MSTKDYNDYQAAAALSLIPDEENPVMMFNQTHRDLLVEIANGRLDCVQLAHIQLQNRGLDIETGKFVGWKKESEVTESAR